LELYHLECSVEYYKSVLAHCMVKVIVHVRMNGCGIVVCSHSLLYHVWQSYIADKEFYGGGKQEYLQHDTI